jgi:hypothetical protein
MARLALKFVSDHAKVGIAVQLVTSRLKGLVIEPPADQAADPVIVVKASASMLAAKADQLALPVQNKNGLLTEFSTSGGAEFPEPLFCSAQQAFLLNEIVESVTCGPAFNSLLSKDAQQAAEGDELVHSLLRHNILDCVSLLHETGEKLSIWHAIKFSVLSTANINLIRNYYGSEVAIYFAWMDHFTSWLALPGE